LHAMALIYLFILFVPSFVSAQQSSSQCLSIVSPMAGTIISSGVCTLHVNHCDQIKNVTFKIAYLDDQNVVDTVTIGEFRSPPYKLLWQSASIPNQVGTGATFIATAALKNNDTLSKSVEAIFLTHNPVWSPAHKTPFGSFKMRRMPSANFSIVDSNNLHLLDGTSAWDKKGLKILAIVHDSTITKDKVEQGSPQRFVEIFIDPQATRRPYIHDNIVILRVYPSERSEQIIVSSKILKDGSITVDSQTIALDSRYVNTDIRNNKQWQAYVHLPNEFFPSKLINTYRMNISATLPDQSGSFKRFFYRGDNLNDAAAPLNYARFDLEAMPLTGNGFLMGFFGFIISFLAVIIWHLLSSPRRKLQRFDYAKQSERDKMLNEKVSQSISRNISKNDLGIELVAGESMSTPKQISAMLRRIYGANFSQVVIQSRIEIAKERLRSTNSSEESIAISCGFKSVAEMERNFWRYSYTSPKKYRADQQVT